MVKMISILNFLKTTLVKGELLKKEGEKIKEDQSLIRVNKKITGKLAEVKGATVRPDLDRSPLPATWLHPASGWCQTMAC